MTQDDQTQNCRPSKKSKQRKVPQRGLGVAQLEKIRIEEQQKKDVAIASPAILLSPSSVSPSNSSHLPLPIPNFHPYNQPSSSPISLHSGSPLSLHNIDVKVSSAVLVPGHGYVPKLWSSNEYDSEKSLGVDPGLSFLPSLPYDSNSNPIRPNPKWVQRTQHQQPSSSSMVNVSSGPSSTPALRCTMEPPSNQNYSGNCIPWQLEEKIIGMKRPYPFYLDAVPPAPTFNFRLPTFAAPVEKNDTTSCGSGSGFNYAGSATFREVPSFSTSNSEPNSKRSIKENENFNGDFLSLAPPTSTTSCPPSNLKSPSTFPGFHNQEYPFLESLSCQGIIEDQITEVPDFSRFNQQQQVFYSFFPPVAKAAQIGQTTAGIQSCNEVGENVDLTLKL